MKKKTKLHNGGRITHFGHPTEPQIQKQSSKDHNLVSDNEKGGFQLVLYHTQPGIIGFFSFRIGNTKEYSQSKEGKVGLAKVGVVSKQ